MQSWDQTIATILSIDISWPHMMAIWVCAHVCLPSLDTATATTCEMEYVMNSCMPCSVASGSFMEATPIFSYYIDCLIYFQPRNNLK